MKIKIVDTTSNQPLANTKIQLQVKGKDSGFLTLTTDAKGFAQLEDKYQGQQVATSQGAAGGGVQGQWITAKDGAQLYHGAKQSTSVSGK